MIFSLLNEHPLAVLAFIFALTLAITVHEFSHALVAYLQGDRTASDAGRLTLNPLAHLDLWGTVMLFFVGFGWGKPVPLNPYNLKYSRFGPIFVALAGPISNFLLFLLAGISYRAISLYSNLSGNNLLLVFLILLGMLNLGLMFFNLLPIPPLDGSQLFSILIPDRYAVFKERFFQYGPTVLFILILSDVLFGVSTFSWLSGLMERVFFSVF